jgi:hypothetical protein
LLFHSEQVNPNLTQNGLMRQPFGVMEVADWLLADNLPDQSCLFEGFLSGDFGRLFPLHRPAFGDYPSMGFP